MNREHAVHEDGVLGGGSHAIAYLGSVLQVLLFLLVPHSPGAAEPELG